MALITEDVIAEARASELERRRDKERSIDLYGASPAPGSIDSAKPVDRNTPSMQFKFGEPFLIDGSPAEAFLNPCWLCPLPAGYVPNPFAIWQVCDKHSKDAAGVKHDSDKLPEHLYSIPAHIRLLQVLKAGAAKYGERNWEKGMDWSRVYAAIERHLHAWWNGENLDPETKLSHLAHAAANIMFLNHYEATETGRDDRSTPKNA